MADDPDATDTVLVREMGADDVERVGELTLESYDRYGQIEGPYRDFLADPRRRVGRSTAVLVAELEGEVVGTVTFVLPHDEEWEGRAVPEGDAAFRVLAVDAGAEGRGVGRRLVEDCVDRARRHGCRRLVISSMAWMTRAHQLYRSLGFERRPDLDVRFPGGLGVVFTLDLVDDAAEHFPPPGPIPAEPPWFEDVWAPSAR